MPGAAFNLSLAGIADAAGGEDQQADQDDRKARRPATRLSSARGVRSLRDLTRLLRPRAAVPAVGDFLAEVSEKLTAAAGHAAPR